MSLFKKSLILVLETSFFTSWWMTLKRLDTDFTRYLHALTRCCHAIAGDLQGRHRYPCLISVSTEVGAVIFDNGTFALHDECAI